MAEYEVKKGLFRPGAIFYDDHIKVLKKGKEIIIPTEDIVSIDYDKPGFQFALSILSGIGGVNPGLMTIVLKRKIEGSSVYLIKIKHRDIHKLPHFYKVKIGYSDYHND